MAALAGLAAAGGAVDSDLRRRIAASIESDFHPDSRPLLRETLRPVLPSPPAGGDPAPAPPALSWRQGLAEVHVDVPLAPRSGRPGDPWRAAEVSVAIARGSITVAAGPGPPGGGPPAAALAGTLFAAVAPLDSFWVLEGPAGRQSVQLTLSKVSSPAPAPWWSLFADGRFPKAPRQVLTEVVGADDPPLREDELDEGARELLRDMRERQAMVASGEIDLEASFDDFQIAVGAG